MRIGVSLIPGRPRRWAGSCGAWFVASVAKSHLTRRLFQPILGRIGQVRGTPRNQEPYGVKAMKSVWSGVSEQDGRSDDPGTGGAHNSELRR
jgi:hypothetical protein